MSDKQDLTERTSEDIREEKEEMDEFKKHLIKHSQTRAVTMFTAGSSSEIFGQALKFDIYHLKDDSLDQDKMTYHDDIYAFPCNQKVPEQFSGKVVRIYSVPPVHAGYTKLLREDESGTNLELQYNDIRPHLTEKKQGESLTEKQQGKSPANTYKFKEEFKKFFDNWPDVSKESTEKIYSSKIDETDDVGAVHCPFWPTEANEWITRPRMNGSPSNATVRDVVRHGCDFVRKSHKPSTDRNEWRFSFSQAELMIIQSWTTSQRIVYRILNMLNKIINSKIKNYGIKLPMYYFKTLMLWATEEKSTEFWSEDVLIRSTYEILIELTQQMTKKFCSNYFIRCNNMMDHLKDADLSAYTYALMMMMCQLLQTTSTTADLLSNCREVEIDVANRTYNMTAQMSLYSSLLIYEQIEYTRERDTQVFSRNFPSLLHRAFTSELNDVYYNLNGCRKLRNSLVCLADQYHYWDAYNKNHIASGRNSSSLQLVSLQHCSATVYNFMINKWFLKTDYVDQKSLLFSRAVDDIDQKSLLLFRAVDDVDKMMRDDRFDESVTFKSDTVITLRTTATIDSWTGTANQLYKGSSSISPTVNISWFINKAYLANLYYGSQHKYSVAEHTCNNIINIAKLSYYNQQFAERSLPVILSTEWTSLYDEELQAILGLYSLCSFIFNKTDRSRSVCLGVCPVLFAWYLKCRCAADQMDIEKWNKCIIKASEHLKGSNGDPRVDNRSEISKKSGCDTNRYLNWCVGDGRVSSGWRAIVATVILIANVYKKNLAL